MTGLVLAYMLFFSFEGEAVVRALGPNQKTVLRVQQNFTAEILDDGTFTSDGEVAGRWTSNKSGGRYVLEFDDQWIRTNLSDVAFEVFGERPRLVEVRRARLVVRAFRRTYKWRLRVSFLFDDRIIEWSERGKGYAGRAMP